MAPGLQVHVFRALVLICNNVDIYNEMHKFNILPQKYSHAHGAFHLLHKQD